MAGLSIETAYDSVGSKAALLLALNDELDNKDISWENAAVVQRLEILGAWRPGVRRADAQAALSGLTDAASGLLLHHSYGWSTRRVEGWLVSVIQRLLLG